MEEFILLVSQMREAQRNYFRSRDPYNLQIAKRLEMKVDAKLSQFLPKEETPKLEPQHPTLF